jgi:hypothetical protein
VGGADQPNVDRFFLRCTDFADLFLLDCAQQFHLHGKRQVGDLVEEQRAAARGLKEPVTIGFGTGERSLPIAEELAFHQVLGNGSAVDGNERVFGPGTQSVDHPCG